MTDQEKQEKEYKAFHAILTLKPCCQGAISVSYKTVDRSGRIESIDHRFIHALVAIVPEEWQSFLDHCEIPKELGKRDQITIQKISFVCKATSKDEY